MFEKNGQKTEELFKEGSSRFKNDTYLNSQKRDEFVHKSSVWSSSARNFIPYNKTKTSI